MRMTDRLIASMAATIAHHGHIRRAKLAFAARWCSEPASWAQKTGNPYSWASTGLGRLG
jgi:hypothetical protein